MRISNCIKLVVGCLVFISPKLLWANQVEMSSYLRADGKIYVVIAVILIVLLALASYLIYLDKKISKLEQQTEKN